MSARLLSAHLLIALISGIILQVVTSSSVSNGSALNVGAFNNGSRTELCPSGWITDPSRRKCFGLMEKLQQWDVSEISCMQHGGHLLALPSDEELGFAKQLCGHIDNGCWVGAKFTNANKSLGWRWSDNISQWNKSVFDGAAFRDNCSNLSCHFNSSLDMCALITNGTASLAVDRCNASHAFLCVVDIENKCSNMHCHREYFIILAVVSGLILCTTFAVIVWLLAYRQGKRRRKSRKLTDLDPAASASITPTWKIFASDELRSITKNFSEGNRLLGDAKTGGTYSGLLSDGSKVAVKRLKRSSFQRKKEFYSEIRRVARLHHPNLVTVKGCCYDYGDRYIVYEFIANGPLDRWLHHIPRGGRSLDWAMRMKIATTLAQGIAFLHDKVKPQVVHRDISASNVLIDEEFGAHLMGVGLSKIVPREAMQERTVMAGGTYGYLAPEFVYRNELTTKSDVYSFGVLLLEIVSGRRPAQQVDSMGWQSIFEWATPLVQAHHYLELLDPHVHLSASDIPESGVIQKVVDLVYACTQNVPSMRPRMSHVVHQLQLLT